MFLACRYAVATVAFVLVAGCRGRAAPGPAPADPFVTIAVSPIPLGALAGSRALLMSVGAVILGDSLETANPLAERTATLREAANRAIDVALRRDAAEVSWVGLAEQRRAMRLAPGLAVDPDHLPTAYLATGRTERVPEPLWSAVRTLTGLTGARLAIVPAAAKIAGTEGAVTASYVFVLMDARVGRVVWRGRSVGAASSTLEAALASAAGAAVAGLVR